MKTPRLHISDHAVVRYLQRVQGVDISAVRREIARATELGEDHPGCSGVISNGFVYKIRDEVITTVVPAHRPHQHRGQQDTSQGKIDD